MEYHFENLDCEMIDYKNIKEKPEEEIERENTIEKQKTKRPLDGKRIEKFNQELDNTGIVYMSRIPPNMKPQKVRQLLSVYGQINRIYLRAEDDKNRIKRAKSGGNKRKQFVEGWIEFLDKRIAKLVVESLNNTTIQDKNMAYFSGDLWNLKYLSKFKWIHLKEQMAYEKKEREKKMIIEMEKRKRELGVYLKNVDKGKKYEIIEKKRREKQKTQQESVSESLSKEYEIEGEIISKVRRKFKQRKVIKDDQIINRDQIIKDLFD